MPEPKRVPAQQEPTPEDAERIGTLGSIFPEVPDMPEVDIDPVYVTMPAPDSRMVEVRIGPDPVEDMSWCGGGRVETYSFGAGQRVVVPAHIAEELERIDKLR